MTLQELLKGKTLPINIRRLSWPTCVYLEICFFDEKGAIGFFDRGNLCKLPFHPLNTGSWELYTEPKKKIEGEK